MTLRTSKIVHCFTCLECRSETRVETMRGWLVEANPRCAMCKGPTRYSGVIEMVEDVEGLRLDYGKQPG